MNRLDSAALARRAATKGLEEATPEGRRTINRLDPVTLEGHYVRLEPLTTAHVPRLLAVALGARDTFGLTTVPSGETDMVSYVATLLRDHADGRALPFATIDRARGQVVGATRFLDVQFWSWPADSPYQRGAEAPDVVEIGGTWLAPSAQRTGINTEAKLLMLTHAFETWRVHRVSLKTDARNARSRAAILRLGARFDGILRAARLAADHTIRDDANYSILDGEWPTVKERLVSRLHQ
jgi:RimJ/RimL family protein N-acetyltransferase